MHIRDFVGSHSFRELKDSLPYFRRQGVNALQIMPVTEFETNDSWGYNPSYFFALDKYYGPASEFRALVDETHRQGIAVILDMVLNHAMGQNPMVRMYWCGSRPSPDNPWLNPAARHPFSVGFDFNWDSPYTKAYFKRVLQHWIREFKVDGFRIDLSKGLTQKDTYGDVPAWNALDPARVAVLTELLDAMRQADPDVYVILEHFGSDEEEKILADKGFLLQGNSSYDHGSAVQGVRGGIPSSRRSSPCPGTAFDLRFFNTLGEFVNSARGTVTEEMLAGAPADADGYRTVGLRWYPVSETGQQAGTGAYIVTGRISVASRWHLGGISVNPPDGRVVVPGVPMAVAPAAEAVDLRFGYVTD